MTIPGQPVAQPRHKISSRGGFGRAYIPARHPIHEYRKQIQAAAARAFAVPLEGPVQIELEFIFCRPESHWNKTGLRSTAPVYPPKNDFDNLAKAATDPLNTIAFLDDEQICSAVIKRAYAKGRNESGCTVIRISTLAQSAH